MNRRRTWDWLTALAVAAALTCVLPAPIQAAAGHPELAGASLALEGEMQQALWSGPAFDFLVGLAIGASVAALFRAYQIFIGQRRSPA